MPGTVLRSFTHIILTVMPACKVSTVSYLGDKETKVLSLSDLRMVTQLSRERAKIGVHIFLVPKFTHSFQYISLPRQCSIQLLLRYWTKSEHSEISITWFF